MRWKQFVKKGPELVCGSDATHKFVLLAWKIHTFRPVSDEQNVLVFVGMYTTDRKLVIYLDTVVTIVNYSWNPSARIF